MNNSVLVLAAHPDDEVLGCGGTIAKMVQSGKSVHVAFLADGVSSRFQKVDISGKDLESRRCAARNACKILGVSEISFGEFPDNRMDTVPLIDVARYVEKLIIKYRPELVFTHHPGDLNVDHRRAHEAVSIACRPQSNCSVKTILCFEVLSSTEWQLSGAVPSFNPNWYEDISETLELKMLALESYGMEMRDWPHPRSSLAIDSLAKWRGATAGFRAAEAFMLGRKLV